VTSAQTAARFRELYEGRGAHLVALERKTSWVALTFREFVLSIISKYVAKQTATIWRDVRDDWGDVGIRRVQRALQRLVVDGAIVRTPDGYVRARK
jgi:hypothetical protein